MNTKQPDNAKIIEAIESAKGNISVAARHLGVSRQTFYDWLEKDENLRTELEHAREQLCDLAENVLIQHLEQGSLKAAVFVLKHIGRRKDLVQNETASFVPPLDVHSLLATIPEWIEPEMEAQAVA